MLVSIVRRIIFSIPVVIGIAVLSFLLVHVIPGSPAALILGTEATNEQIIRLEHELGLDQPLFMQFFYWTKNVLRGDMGTSIFLKQPVVDAIINRMGTTLTLATAGLLVAIFIGLPSGILSALKKDSIIDIFTMNLAIIGISIASFWLALNLTWLFGVN